LRPGGELCVADLTVEDEELDEAVETIDLAARSSRPCSIMRATVRRPADAPVATARVASTSRKRSGRFGRCP